MTKMPVMTEENTQVLVDVVVVDHDGERADMDNPNGEVYGFAAYVRLQGPRGDQWNHRHRFVGDYADEKALAEKAEALRQRMIRAGRKPSPEHWVESYPAWGTPAEREQLSDPEQVARLREEGLYL